MNLKAVKMWLVDLIFPPKCLFCGRIIDSAENYACKKCEVELPYTFGRDVFIKTQFISTGVVPFFYRDSVREAVLQFKFNGKESYADGFGEYMAACVLENLQLPEIITWVPVSKKRKKKRGYDQAQLLAESVSRRLGVQVCPTLVKTVDNPAQSSIKDSEARKANVLGVYDICCADAIEGKSVMLVDDVFTTGATVSECARMLLTAGAENVSCAVFARR